VWLAGWPARGDSEAMDTTCTSFSAPAAALAAPAFRQSETLLLPCGRALTLAPGACLLQVDAGRIWLTRSGDLDDHFIAAGECFEHDGHGVLVIECDSASTAVLRISPRGPCAAP
jgi:hypothetical protein